MFVIVRCPAIGFVTNGRTTTQCQTYTQNPGKTCPITCFPGYTQRGPDQMHTCEDTGSWAPSVGDIYCTRKLSCGYIYIYYNNILYKNLTITYNNILCNLFYTFLKKN